MAQAQTEGMESIQELLEQKSAPVNTKKKNGSVSLGQDILRVGSKAVLGAAIGVGAGMALVAGAAALEGPLLSYVIFTKVLGVAGAAGGAAHSINKIVDEKKAPKK